MKYCHLFLFLILLANSAFAERVLLGSTGMGPQEAKLEKDTEKDVYVLTLRSEYDGNSQKKEIPFSKEEFFAFRETYAKVKKQALNMEPTPHGPPGLDFEGKSLKGRSVFKLGLTADCDARGLRTVSLIAPLQQTYLTYQVRLNDQPKKLQSFETMLKQVK